jgi:hypothetical protein
MPSIPKYSPLFGHRKDGSVTAIAPPFYDIEGRGEDKESALADLNEKLLMEVPTLSDQEFSLRLQRQREGLNTLHEEVLRNPTPAKVDVLLHSLRVLVDDLSHLAPVNEGAAEEHSDPYRAGVLGTDESRSRYNDYLKLFAGRKWTWPCSVEIQKGLSGMTFPRSGGNDSGLEKHLDSIQLGKTLIGKQTTSKKSGGTSYKKKDGSPTFSGFVMNEVEKIEIDKIRVSRFPPEEERPDNFKFPSWLKETEALTALSVETVDDWVSVILTRLTHEDCVRLEDHWFLWPALKTPYLERIKSNSGGTFTAYVRQRIKAALKKLFP